MQQPNSHAVAQQAVPAAAPAAGALPDEKRRMMSWIMVGLGGALTLGSFLPWATSSLGGSINGLTATLGYATLAGGIVLGLYGYQGLRQDNPAIGHHAWAITAVVVSIFATTVAYSVIDDLGGIGGVVGAGAGLWITLLASFVAIWPLVQLRKDGKARSREAERNEVSALAAEIRAGGAHHPPAAGPSIPARTPPGWYGDPTLRHERRYHDGSAWTAHVVDGAQQAVDPIDGRGG